MDSVLDQSQRTNEHLKLITSCQNPNAQQWVICPFAGGSSSAFRGWQTLTEIKAQLVVYPGRDHRIREAPVTHIEGLALPLVRTILDDENIVHQGYILCGHSMGAQVAYEACRLLEQHGKAPQTLVLSACHAPHLRGRRLLSHLNDQDFITELVNIGGCSPQLAANSDLLNLFLPMLRADFQATEQYSQSLTSMTGRLATAVVLVYGQQDIEANKDEVEAWRHWLYQNQVQSLAMSGGHFYLTESPESFIHGIQQLVASLSGLQSR